MRKKGIIIGFIVGLLLVLSACGGSGGLTGKKAFSGNLKKIEFDDLIEKLDNEESFFLLTVETTDEAFVESGLEETFDKALKEQGIEAYYYGIETMDEADKEVYEEHVERLIKLDEYSKFENSQQWYPLSSGLVYVEHGIVEPINGHLGGSLYWEDIERLLIENDPEYHDIQKRNVEYDVKTLKEKGIID